MNSKTNISRITLLILFGLLSACGPRMSTVTDYVPPVTDSGMRCVAAANQDRATCDSDNLLAFQQCSERAAIDADGAFIHAKNTYTNELEQYIVDNELYEHDIQNFHEQKRLVLRDGELEYIKCSDDVKMESVEQFPKCEKFLKKAKKRAKKLRPPLSPEKPYAPNRNRMYNDFLSSCNNIGTNCQMVFDQSYRTCGGTINSRQVCISNCQ